MIAPFFFIMIINILLQVRGLLGATKLNIFSFVTKIKVLGEVCGTILVQNKVANDPYVWRTKKKIRKGTICSKDSLISTTYVPTCSTDPILYMISLQKRVICVRTKAYLLKRKWFASTCILLGP